MSIPFLTWWSWLCTRVWRWPLDTDSQIDPWCHRGRVWCLQSPAGEERPGCHNIRTQVPAEPGINRCNVCMWLTEHDLAWLLSYLFKMCSLTCMLFRLKRYYTRSFISPFLGAAWVLLQLAKDHLSNTYSATRWRCATKAVSKIQSNWLHVHELDQLCEK